MGFVYTRMTDGYWGVRTDNMTTEYKPGTEVQVLRRDGTPITEVIERYVTTDRFGRVFAITKKAPARRSRARFRRKGEEQQGGQQQQQGGQQRDDDLVADLRTTIADLRATIATLQLELREAHAQVTEYRVALGGEP